MRSAASYGYAELANRVALGAKSYDHTHYAQGNVVWSPIERMCVGIEYLYGKKVTRDGSDGVAHRGQLSVQYKIF